MSRISSSPTGLYVHVPFCAASCPYCDYPHAVAFEDEAHDAFVEALLAEIKRRGPRTGVPVETLYFGGGTPSRLSAAHWEDVFGALRAAFDCSGLREVTLEANPNDLRESWLRALRRLGVSRLSLGVQSFSGEDLSVLGRRHGAAEAERAVPAARAAGFENVSVDLVFGVPGQTLACWQATLERAVLQKPAHVTLYRLTAPPGTPLGRRVATGALALPGGEAGAAQYECALDVLGAAGLRLYEQTHLARPGFEARHTPRYWRHDPVLGLGPGARSFQWNTDGSATRRANAADWRAYVGALSDGASPPHTSEHFAPADLADEYLAQRLRTARGLSLGRLARHYGRDLRAERGPTLARLCDEGYLEQHGRRPGAVRPTRAGRLRLDTLTAALL